jgi:hypothetical protein
MVSGGIAGAIPALALLVGAAGAQIGMPSVEFRRVGSERIDPNFGVSFKLLPRWKIEKAGRWNDDGELATTVSLHDPQKEAFAALYCRLFRSGETRTPQEIDRLLLAGVDAKISQRVRQGLVDYRIRPKSCEPRTIGGRRALSCVEDYTEKNRNMAEHLTWVRTEVSPALFFTRMPAEKLNAFRERFNPTIESLRIP